MPQTLSVIKAGVGGHAGPGAMQPDVLEAARQRLVRAVEGGVLIDAQALACGDGLALVLSHEHGPDSTDVHLVAWEALFAAAGTAEGLRLHAAGHGLLAEVFPGSIHGVGASAAELELSERPSEPVVVLMAGCATTGALNLSLARAFMDPFTTPALVLAEALHAGFAFEVHDLAERKKAMFTAPEESYDLLAYAAASPRFVVKRIVSRSTGEVAAVASASRASSLAGGTEDAPLAVVRASGAFPPVADVLAPFATPAPIDGAAGGVSGAWIPAGLESAPPEGLPWAAALGFQVADGRLGAARDYFADASYDHARRRASDLAEALRAHGRLEAHPPAAELETTVLPSVAARTAGRWSDL